MFSILPAESGDAAAILELQKTAYQSEAALYNDWNIPPLTQPLDSVLAEFEDHTILKSLSGERIIGSVRAKVDGGVCFIGKLMVHPDFQGRGAGSALLKQIEACFPSVLCFQLFTGSLSEANIRLYQRHGYKIVRTQPLTATVSLIYLEKSATGIASAGDR